MTRGEIWLADVRRKRRPVLVLTRSEVLDVRALVTVAEITTSLRGISAEVGLDAAAAGLGRPSAVNCDALHTIAQSRLTERVGSLDEDTMRVVCDAIGDALGCHAVVR